MANRVATIILNRPDKLNARTALIEREVSAAMGSAEEGQRHPSHRFDGRWLGLCAGVDMSLPSAVAEHGLDDQGREQVLRNGTNRARSPRSLRVIKRQVYEAMFQTLSEAFDISVRETMSSFQTRLRISRGCRALR